MRWSIVRLIWLRELRDQLRDRRTIFMIAVLPVLIYPVAGFGVMQLAKVYFGQQHRVGIVGADNLVPWAPPPPPPTPGPTVAWLAFTPPGPAAPLAGVSQLCVAVSLVLAQPRRDYPPLVEMRNGRLAFVERYLDTGQARESLSLESLQGPVPTTADPVKFLDEIDRTPLSKRKVNLLLVIPADFQRRLADDQAPIYLLTREKDESSRLVNLRVTTVINRWKRELKEARLARRGLPINFDEPIQIHDPERAKPAGAQEEDLFSLLVRIFPFVLVMWSLAGALYPAVDLCAGEKERGTMETLLISPASREEIVWGKFLTIQVFSAATALLNLLSMALTTSFSGALPGGTLSPMALFWCVLLLLPLSAFFSALCLAVGAYARSSKEGQYYLMPLFLATMPLIFLTLAPGVELNAFYSMVPVTGVALLLQKLMAGAPMERGLWLYFIPVLAPMVLYSWLALRWAIAQFQREEVLFREAERLDIGLWLRRLLRDKEALPNAGEAMACFALILGLRWLSFGIGQTLPLLARTGIAQLAFVFTPPLFMALQLTTRPRLGLGLRLPPWWAWPAALVLAVCLLPPLAELTAAILRHFPALQAMLELHNPLTSELQALSRDPELAGGFFLVLAVLPALCEELAFRGFILTGLLRGFRPRTAILFSAFLFSVYQMNVFQFLPHFLLGVILGLLTVRCGSVLPAMLFHFAHNALLITVQLTGWGASAEPAVWLALTAAGTILAGVGLYVVWRLPGRPCRLS